MKTTSGIKLLMTALFFLIAGLPQLRANIIYTPVSFTYSVGTSPLTSNVIFTANLPGANDLVMYSFSFPSDASNFYQLDVNNYGGSIACDFLESLEYAHSLNAGATWSDTSNGSNWANVTRMAQTGNASFGLRSDPTYVPFWFQDTSNSNQVDYGYITLATTVTGSGASAQFGLNISGYAYDNTGAMIAMGAVPEPSATALATLGLIGIVTTMRYRCKMITAR